MTTDKVFDWCHIGCEYFPTCYDENGGPYFLTPECSEGPIQEKEVSVPKENGKHYRFAKNGRGLFLSPNNGYYQDIYEVAVIVETWFDGELFDWAVYRGYCLAGFTDQEMQDTVSTYGDKQPAGYAYQFWIEDGLPEKRYRY